MRDDIDRILKRDGPLKARQIASKLGIERNKVSAFLHANLKQYQQNSEYEWSCPNVLEIVLPSRWITAKNFENILLKSGYTEAEEKVTIVLSEGSSTLIECTARLLALSNQLASSGKIVVIDFSEAEGIASYLNRAGFFDLLDHRINVLPKRPDERLSRKYRGQSDNLVEFRSIDPSCTNSELVDELTNKFIQLTSSDYTVAALTIFGELIGNVFDHSQTTLRGFAGLQKYKGRIQAVVSDSGLGIAQTLRPALRNNYPSLDTLYGESSLQADIGLVKTVLSQGGISRFGGARGLGFKRSPALAGKFNARFSVRQESFGLDFIYKDDELIEVKEQSGLSKLLGTHICFDFNLAKFLSNS